MTPRTGWFQAAGFYRIHATGISGDGLVDLAQASEVPAARDPQAFVLGTQGNGALVRVVQVSQFRADSVDERRVNHRRRSRAQRRQSRIPLDDGTWKQLSVLAERLKVALPLPA